MSSLMTQYGSRSFYKTPVSKCLLGGVFLASCALHVPIFSHLKQYIVCSSYSIFVRFELWRLITRNIAFLDITGLSFCCFLMYHLRLFERRLGSHKFISHLLGKFVLATMVEILSLLLCRYYFAIDIQFLSCGPLAFIFPLFVDLYYDVPRVTHSHLFGIPITGKSFIYLLGLQVISKSKASLLSGIAGLIGGYLHRKNYFKVQQIIYIPKFMSKMCDQIFGWLLSSSAPQSSIVMGATLELQRQELFDAMEQASISQQLRQFQNLRQQRGQGYAETLVGRQDANGMNERNGPSPFGLSWLRNRGTNTAVAPASPEMVNTLVEMGFERQNVVAALSSSNNDLAAATNILLSQN